MLTVTDIFAGAGGSSTGAAAVPGVQIALAANHPGYRVAEDGTVYGPRGFALKGHTLPDGYQRVTVRGCHILRHVLVAEAFIGPRPEGMQVNHIDGDKGNNHVSNLEYVTPSENVRHSIDVLKTERAPGERNANARLADADVRAMRSLHASGVPATKVGERFGINPTHAWRIATGRSWRHVR